MIDSNSVDDRNFNLFMDFAGRAKTGFNNAAPVAQGTAVPDAVGRATVDAEARAALNALLAYLRTRGDIAT